MIHGSAGKAKLCQVSRKLSQVRWPGLYQPESELAALLHFYPMESPLRGGHTRHSRSSQQRWDSQVSILRPKIPTETLAQTVVLRIRHKFRLRFVEWLGGFQLMGIGWVLMGPGDSLNNNPFHVMHEVMPEWVWALMLFALGLIRIGGLIINGSMEGVTSLIRTTGAFIGFNCFFMISFSMLVSTIVFGNHPPVGLAMFIPSCGAEIAAMICATHDARMYRNGRRAGLV